MSDNLATSYKGHILEAQNLPAMPYAVEELSRLIDNPNSTTEQMARVVIRDQAIAAKVLKMVNSPIYGFPGRISSIQHAMVLLGVNVMRGLIISTAVFDGMNKVMLGLWEHSAGCSIACAEIAKAIGRAHPEEYGLMGLLHDVGKMVLALQLPEAKAEIDDLVKAEDLSFRDAETRVLGFGHDHINTWLCEQWNLPVSLREGIIYHHDPLEAPFYPESASIVHLGNFMVRLFEVGSGGDVNVPRLDQRALRLLGINRKELENILDFLREKMLDKSGLL